jgi:hypothetical protein
LVLVSFYFLTEIEVDSDSEDEREFLKITKSKLADAERRGDKVNVALLKKKIEASEKKLQISGGKAVGQQQPTKLPPSKQQSSAVTVKPPLPPFAEPSRGSASKMILLWSCIITSYYCELSITFSF